MWWPHLYSQGSDHTHMSWVAGVSHAPGVHPLSLRPHLQRSACQEATSCQWQSHVCRWHTNTAATALPVAPGNSQASLCLLQVPQPAATFTHLEPVHQLQGLAVILVSFEDDIGQLVDNDIQGPLLLNWSAEIQLQGRNKTRAITLPSAPSTD